MRQNLAAQNRISRFFESMYVSLFGRPQPTYHTQAELEIQENKLIERALDTLQSPRFTAIANDALAIDLYRNRCAEAFVMLKFFNDAKGAMKLMLDSTDQELIDAAYRPLQPRPYPQLFQQNPTR